MPESARQYLEPILAFHRMRVEADTQRRNFESTLKDALNGVNKMNSSPKREFNFSKALNAKKEIGIIAEIKRRSPSKGDLRKELTSAELISLAKDFEQAGAIGISVLTDEKHFGGSLDDLRSVVGETNLPVLRKDFILSGLDVVDAFEAGASAILIIMAAFAESENSQVETLLGVAFQLGLDVFCEVHTVEELERAALLQANHFQTNPNSNPNSNQCILVNQRNLHTFEEYPNRAVELAQHFSVVLPEKYCAIAASCINSAGAVQEVAASGYSAVLVGEHLMKSLDPGAALKELLS